MMEQLRTIPVLPVVLTLFTFYIGTLCQKKTKLSLCNPILISAVLVIVVMKLTGMSDSTYQWGMKNLSWLLTPATVCLALPLYEQLKVLKKSLPAILAGIAAGTVTSLVFVLGVCKLFSLDSALTTSLLPKSITTAMGMVLSEQNGGIGALTAAAIIITGILGSLVGSTLCKLLRIHDPVAQGVAFGTASHVVGTSRATELGSLQGAVSSLSLAIAGILTAVIFPIILSFV